MEFLELAKKRYSVRKFSDKPVEAGKLAKLLEAGNIAPTAKNQQPQRIYVIQTPENLAKLAKITPCLYGAKTALIFAYDENEEWKNPLEKGIHSGVQDVSIVATHIMLAAEELGLGTCWVNYFSNSEAEKAFSLPENEKAVLIMPIGYAAADSVPAPGHAACKPLEKTVKHI